MILLYRKPPLRLHDPRAEGVYQWGYHSPVRSRADRTFVSKPLAKITVRCPHCGSEQLEPEQAKSTYCRRCSQYFAITATAIVNPNAPVAAVPSVAAKPRLGFPSLSTTEPSGSAGTSDSAGGGFKQKIESFLASKPRQRTARCFECSSAHEVSSTAQSSTCKACGAYIDLQDYKISGSFSRNIKTRGSVYLSSKGDLSSSKIVCSQATLHGKMRGNLHCDGMVTLRMQGKLPGSVEAGEMIIEKGSEVIFTRPLKASSVVVYGKMSGPIQSDGHVAILKSGSLDGAVTAKGFTVEKGGVYQGELTITPRLNPELSASENSEGDSENGALPARSAPSPIPYFLGGERKPAHG